MNFQKCNDKISGRDKFAENDDKEIQREQKLDFELFTETKHQFFVVVNFRFNKWERNIFLSLYIRKHF